jgi:hypothetical protein
MVASGGEATMKQLNKLNFKLQTRNLGSFQHPVNALIKLLLEALILEEREI